MCQIKGINILDFFGAGYFWATIFISEDYLFLLFPNDLIQVRYYGVFIFRDDQLPQTRQRLHYLSATKPDLCYGRRCTQTYSAGTATYTTASKSKERKRGVCLYLEVGIMGIKRPDDLNKS